MYTRVTRDQFEIRDGVYIHKPTHAEFAPNPINRDSILIYTASIGSRLESGELFDYREVLTEMKILLEEKREKVDSKGVLERLGELSRTCSGASLAGTQE